MKTFVSSASVEFISQPFLKPMRLSSGLITEATEARVAVTVEIDGRSATGRGSIYLSDLWAWPGGAPDRVAKDRAMRELCGRIASLLSTLCGSQPDHPLELGLRLSRQASLLPEAQCLPELARHVCASPFDAAIHDAAGQALNLSAFRFYDSDMVLPLADSWFPGEGAAHAIRQTLRTPVLALDAWWAVSMGDDLEVDVRPYVLERGIRCFKLKLLGQNAAGDAARTVEVFEAACRWGLEPRLSIDSNEGHADVVAVADYLDRVAALHPAAYAAIEYLEQPTSRHVQDHPPDWRRVVCRKPVLLDEGLTSLDLLPLVKTQAWSGLALKTCKGHSFTLVAGAWARRNGLSLSLQDLTNPGYSAVHSFLLGAHLNTINGIELNSPQYTPAANQAWLPALSGIFEPRLGCHRLGQSVPPGLGSSLAGVP